MYVEEKDRSWCTSSSSNDNRAITIEVASDNFHPYAVTDAAYNALIKLLVDICKRNNIKELKWKADKSLIGKVDQQNMTVHRWFASKSCIPTSSEVLTPDGWVKLSNINIGDKIACADLDGLNITFEEVYDKVPERRQDTYTNNGLTATKDHRMVYSVQQSKNVYRIEYFKKLLSYGSQAYIPLAGYSHFDGIDLTNDMIAFYIAVQADGHYMYEITTSGEKHYYGLEFHFIKKRKIDRIKKILGNCNLKYSVTNQTNGSVKIRVYNVDDVNIVTDICEKHLSNKNFTWDWLYMTREQAIFFLKEIQKWDGCESAQLYTSFNKTNLDIVSAIAALNGVGSRVTNNNVQFRNTPYITLGENTKRNNHNKELTTVTCVSVKTGIFLMRQNRKIFIVGNCPRDYLYNLHGQIAEEVNKQLGIKPTPTPTPSSNYIYTVQAGAFSSLDNAKVTQSTLLKQGLPAEIVLMNKYYKVFVGEYETKTEANSMLTKVKKAGISSAYVSKVKTSDFEVVTDDIKKGDKVKVINAVTYTGTPFKVYYDTYDVIQVDGDRVVIGQGKAVTAAVNIKDIVKI